MVRQSGSYTGKDRNARHFMTKKGEYNLAYDDDLDGVLNVSAIPSGVYNISEDDISGTLRTDILIEPDASTTVATITRHVLLGVGDITGNTAYGFGDPAIETRGLMASFGRTTIATGNFADEALDVRAINKLVNTGDYDLKGAYVKAKNYSTGTVRNLVGMFLECVDDGTTTLSTALEIGADASTVDEGIVLDNGTFTVGIHMASAVTTGIKFDNVGTTRAIDIQITPTSADRQLYMDIDYAANAKEAAYIIATSAKITGETIGLRGRGQAAAVGAATGEARGVYGQGVVNEGLYGGTMTGVFGNAIAKTTSTCVTLRGGFFEAESEGTPTEIANLYGVHTRVKTTVAPTTDFINTLLESEKMGSGVAMDSFLRFKTTTWAGGDTVSTDVVSLADLTGTVTNIFDYSGPTCTSVFYSSNTATNFLEVSADSKGGAGATRGTPNQTATCDGSLVVKVGSKTLLVPLYNAVTIA